MGFTWGNYNMKKDIIGRRFGKLTVLEYVNQDKRGNRMFLCKCDCGNEKVVCFGHLNQNHTKSCGCLKYQGHAKTHGLSNSSEYTTWFHMRKRTGPDSPYHCRHNYYDRGIRCCQRWKKFENFIADMGLKPTPKHTLERIDNDGNYEPENCKWATRSEQAKNRKGAIDITYKGVTKNLKDWANDLGFQYLTLYDRVKTRGWPIDKALTLPLGTIYKKINKK